MESTILINEFFPDPVGADKGYEWLEIVNISESEIDISNWEIQVAGVRYNRAFRFPQDSKISSGEYVLVCEEFVKNCDYYTSLLAMQNGINKTDGVRIIDDKGEIINTVLYSRPNKNSLENDFDDIEIEENIIEMPPEGYSIARRNSSNTGFSIQDFFITNSPTPGQENVAPEAKKILISEVAKSYIEFYTPVPPQNTNQWYILIGNTKIYLENTFKENFFLLEMQVEEKDLSLYTPEGILFDTFASTRISENFTYCRPNSKLNEGFVLCRETKGRFNEKKEWVYKTVLEVVQFNKNEYFVINPCVLYKTEDVVVISDETYAHSLKCEGCEPDTCYTAEFNFVEDKLYVIEETELHKISVELVTNQNYLNLLNRVVKIEVDFLDSNPIYTYFSSEIGLIRVQKHGYGENSYLLKGVLRRSNNEVFDLLSPIIVSQKELEQTTILENTGSSILIPLTILILFFTGLVVLASLLRKSPLFFK